MGKKLLYLQRWVDGSSRLKIKIGNCTKGTGWWSGRDPACRATVEKSVEARRSLSFHTCWGDIRCGVLSMIMPWGQTGRACDLSTGGIVSCMVTLYITCVLLPFSLPHGELTVVVCRFWRRTRNPCGALPVSIIHALITWAAVTWSIESILSDWIVRDYCGLCTSSLNNIFKHPDILWRYQ